MTVSNEERLAMANLLAIMNGQQPTEPVHGQPPASAALDDVGGPGAPSKASIDAMANVLESLNRVTQQVMFEDGGNAEVRMAAETARTDDGVRVGGYQITIMTNEKRLAGKQYYQISHGRTGTVIANDISLYEVASAVAKLLNDSRYVNNFHVRRLFELDDRYTSHRIDALNHRRQQRLAEQRNDGVKMDIAANKYEHSLEQALRVKRDIKVAIREASDANR
jgi:hypothetical protein